MKWLIMLTAPKAVYYNAQTGLDRTSSRIAVISLNMDVLDLCLTRGNVDKQQNSALTVR